MNQHNLEGDDSISILLLLGFIGLPAFCHRSMRLAQGLAEFVQHRAAVLVAVDGLLRIICQPLLLGGVPVDLVVGAEIGIEAVLGRSCHAYPVDTHSRFAFVDTHSRFAFVDDLLAIFNT